MLTLFLRNGSVISPQNNTGNEWIDAPIGNNGKQAKCMGNVNALLNRFYVNTDLNCGDMPNPLLPTFGWFNTSTGNNSCCSYTFCGIPDFINDEVTPLDFTLINDSIENDPYTDETLWMLSKNLYKRLDDNPLLRETYDSMEYFYNEHEESNIAYLNQVSNSKNQLYAYNETLLESMNDRITESNSILDEINDKILLIQTDTTLTPTEIEELQNQVHEHYSSFESMIAEYNSLIGEYIDGKNSFADELYATNEAIESELQIEINEKQVNGIYLATFAKGIMEFEPEQEEILITIAAQCPNSGGNAVFQAIAMLYSVDPYLEIDYDTLCGISSEERMGMINQLKAENYNYLIYPVPATDHITISGGSSSEPIHFILYNSFGQIVINTMLSSSDFSYKLSLEAIPSGIYHYTIYLDTNTSANRGKLAVIR